MNRRSLTCGRKPLHLPMHPGGIVLLTYQHEPIGFVKNIGNRANNLYPNEWRIRSGYLPQVKPDIFSPQHTAQQT